MLPVNITIGFIIDLIFGDPYNFPHPVKLIGKLITGLEKLLTRFQNQRIAGIILAITIIMVTYCVTRYISEISVIIEILFIYTVFCTKSLALEAKKIYSSLYENDLDRARTELAMLVSRDTGEMEQEEIIRATVETVSENIVDGIISPMFYLFIGGLPLAYAYKGVSTLDSMVGYKNKQYMDLGWASARLDDLLNYVPARLTAFVLIPVAAFISGKSPRDAARIAFRDRRNHSSPNSALPEAAVAGALGCQLGGPAKYFGQVSDKPTIGDNIKNLEKQDILESVKLMYATSIIGLIFGCIIYYSIS